MWVYVTDRDGDWYRGQLQNDPVTELNPGPGSVVWFKKEHVADIDTPPDGFIPR